MIRRPRRTALALAAAVLVGASQRVEGQTLSKGHILVNSGMPSSGPMIEASIRKLGFQPEEVNPGYQLAVSPSYPGIGDDCRRSLHRLEMLRPDVWLPAHAEWFDLAGKRARAATEGVRAWVDPEGYRRFVAGQRRNFEDKVDQEMGVPPAAEARK